MNRERVQLDTRTGQLRTIHLGGSFGRRFGYKHRMAVDSPAEAIRALRSQFRGIDKYLIDSKDKGVGYVVFVGKRNIDKDQLHDPCGDNVIKIAPTIMGGKSPWIRIIIGVILIAVSLMVDWSGTTATMIGSAMFSMGMAMAMGGVVQLLTPQPKGMSSKDRPDNQPSYNFNGPVNTQAQGHPVPILYGELIVGSAVVSAGITAVDQAYIPAAGSGAAGGGTTALIREIIINMD
jgi:predicted phage tail protein